MCDLSEGYTFLILQFVEDGLTYLILCLISVLHPAACPVCVYLDSEGLILFEVVVELEGQVVLPAT
jgi:hypothetical protein